MQQVGSRSVPFLDRVKAYKITDVLRRDGERHLQVHATGLKGEGGDRLGGRLESRRLQRMLDQIGVGEHELVQRQRLGHRSSHPLLAGGRFDQAGQRPPCLGDDVGERGIAHVEVPQRRKPPIIVAMPISTGIGTKLGIWPRPMSVMRSGNRASTSPLAITSSPSISKSWNLREELPLLRTRTIMPPIVAAERRSGLEPNGPATGPFDCDRDDSPGSAHMSPRN